MIRKERQPKSRIPQFSSIQEEAEFWDTHDTTDFEGEFKPVKVRFAKNLSEGTTIRLDPDPLKTLKSQAQEKGLGPTPLARMWILERLKEQASDVGTAHHGRK